MRDEGSTLPVGEDAALASSLDPLAQQFETEWASGSRPRIADFLPRVAAQQRPALLARLMQVEMDLQSRSGETFAYQDYRSQFPEYSDVVEAVLAAQSGTGKKASAPRQGSLSTISPGETDHTTAASPSASHSGKRGSSAPPTPGVIRFGDYDLLGEIARGGMGVVYKARQIKLNRIVALKMILAGQFASDEDVQRFYSEAEAAAKLDHPGIVPIYEVNEVDGRHYFSMGFIDGKSLHERVANGPLPQREAAELVRQVAQAVQYAHQHGVVHRDLKPRNILLTAQGTPKVTDFGLAKRVDGGSDLTMSGQILGTPGYMPPEQASGQLDAVGPHSDVYSLGGVLYCLITGRPPFQSANVVETIKQVLETPPVPPRLMNPAIDRDLETICLKCLEKEASHRYPSAGELADELQRYLDGEPIKAVRTGLVQRGWRWIRRRPLVAALGGSLAVLAVVIALAVGVGQKALSTHRLNTLQREIEAGLDAPELTPAYLRRMDELVAGLAYYDAAAAEQIPPRLNAALAKNIRGEIRSPKVDEQLVQSLTAAIDLLQPRDAALAAALREELGRRQRDWQRVFQLVPPFAEQLKNVLPAGTYHLDENQRLVASVHGQEPSRRVLSIMPSEGLVQLEAQFDESWENAARLGLSINADAQKGYDFILQAEALRSLDDDATSRPASGNETLGFRGLREGDGYFVLTIYRNGLPLVSEKVHQSQIPTGALVLRATREQGELRIQANALPAVSFRDPFPLPASQAGVFGVEWPAGVALLALEGRRKPRPAAVSPLEQGDELYEQGRYAEALEYYQQQALETDDPEFIQESQHKQGMCLLQLGRLEDAGGIFEPLMNASGERWPPLAGCYLWVIRLRQRRETEADNVFDFLSTRFQFAQFATLVPQELRQEISQSYRSGLDSITGLMRYNPDLLANNQRLAAIDRFFSLDGRGDHFTQLEISRAYRLLGDLPRALQSAESIAKDTNNATVARHYIRLLRQNNDPERALAELNAFEARNPRPPDKRDITLSLERARIYALMQDWDRCEESVDQVYQLHRTDRPLDPLVLTYPALMKGMLLERRGAHGPAIEIWGEAFEAMRPHLLQKQAAPNSETVNGLILGSLCGQITDQECEGFFVSVVTREGDTPFTRQAQALANPQVLARALREMWRSPLGRQYAEAFAFETLSLRERVRVPVVLAATEVINHSALRGEMTADQQRVVFDAGTLIFDRTIYDGKMSIAQVAQLILTWKGTTNFLGWGGVASSFDPELRTGLAYIMGHRFLALGNKPRSVQFFDEVLKEAPPDSELARLAAIEKQLLESNQGRLVVTSDLPEMVRLVISQGDQPVSTVEISGGTEIDVPAGDLKIALAAPHAEYRLSPSTTTIAPIGRRNVELRWLWKPSAAEQTIPGLLPAPAANAIGGRWQLFHRDPTQTRHSLAWSGDGKRIAVASADGLVRIYDSSSRELTGILYDAPAAMRELIWGPHPSRIIACGQDRRIVGWDADTGRKLFHSKDHNGGATALAWNASASHFVSAGYEAQVRLWTAGGTPVADFKEDSGVEALALSPDAAWVVSRTWNPDNYGHLKAWEVKTGKSRQITGPGESGYGLLAFSPDGKMFAGGSSAKFVRLWRVADWKPVATVELEDHWLTDLDWSADSRTLFLTTKSGDFYEIAATASPPALTRRTKVTGFQTAKLSPDTKSLVANNNDGTLSIVTLADGTAQALGQMPRALVESAMRPGGSSQVAALGSDAVIRIFDDQGRSLMATNLPRASRASEMAWNPAGSRLAVVLNDGSVAVCSAEGGEPVIVPAQVADRPQPLAWSSDGQRLLILGDDRQLRAVDPTAGAEPKIEGDWRNLSALARGPGGLLALAASDGKITIQDASGAPMAEFSMEPAREVHRLSFAPDEKSIAVLDQDRLVSLWSLDGTRLATLQGSHGQADGLAWSPDGQRLATVHLDFTVKVWSASGELLQTLQPPGEGRLRTAAWPDSDRLATGGEDAAWRVWKVDRQVAETSTIVLGDQAWVRLDQSGKLLDTSDRMEARLVYGVETPLGTLELLRPSQFAARAGAAASAGGAATPPGIPAVPMATPPGSAPDSKEELLNATQLGTVEDPEIVESSGLARCASRPDAFWTHNDSFNSPTLFLVSTAGQTLARYDLEGATIFDWEDMAAFRRGDQSYLLVGDIGDNAAKRESLKLYLVKEPDATTLPAERASLSLEETIALRYEDGPHDCEALAVDAERNVIMLVNKELAGECWLYEAPLVSDSAQPRVAKRVAKLSLPLVTAMDLSPDGKRLVVLGGLNAFEFQRNDGETWPAALARMPRRYALPAAPQAEAIGYRQDGKALLLTSEGERQPLWEVALPAE